MNFYRFDRDKKNRRFFNNSRRVLRNSAGIEDSSKIEPVPTKIYFLLPESEMGKA